MICNTIKQLLPHRFRRKEVEFGTGGGSLTRGAHGLAAIVFVLLWGGLLPSCLAAETDSADTTNTFPTVPEVLGGQTFENYTQQDIYFLRAIHDRYPSHWTDLLEANLTLNDFVLSPEKMLRFVSELGEAMRGRDDLPACTDLAMITDDPSFYANTNVSRPEILKAAAEALIKIGPQGRRKLASAFTEGHYRTDPASLEVLADAIGDRRPLDADLLTALANTAFSFSTTNGAFYPHCVAAAVKNLLCLTNGPAVLQRHLTVQEVLENPGRFQSVIDGITEARAIQVTKALQAMEPKVQARLAELAKSPGGYRDDLQEFEARLRRALAGLGGGNGTN